MAIATFMATYQTAWETQDAALLASLFTPDGIYRNTPFDAQVGHVAIKNYWQRLKHTTDIHMQYEIIHAEPTRGLAHWRTTDRVISEEIFAIWAQSTGTNLIARPAGAPLPNRILDGMALAEFTADGLCREFRIWWHSRIDEPT